jgi:hypothetical protein
VSLLTLTGRGIVSLIVAIFSLVLLIVGFDYNEKARMIPVGAATIVLVMALLQLMADTFPAFGKRFRFIAGNGTSFETSESNDEEESWKSVFACLAWLIGFVAVLYLTTYLIAVPAFLFLFIWLGGKSKLLPAVYIAAGAWVFLYILFELVLKVNF